MAMYIGNTMVSNVGVVSAGGGGQTGHRFKSYVSPHNGTLSCIANSDHVIYTFNDNITSYTERKLEMTHDGIETVRYTGEWESSYNRGTIYINGVGYEIQANTTYTLLTDNDYADILTAMCLEKNTVITLANGGTKFIWRLKVGDMVMSLNPETLKQGPDEIIMADGEMNKMSSQYDLWKFEGCYDVKTINRHRFYNVERGAFVYLDEWNIGEHTIVQEGKQVALLSHQVIEEEVQHCTIFTKNWNNYYANGLLSGNRDSVKLNIK